MNLYFVIAGIIGLLGGCAHAVLGDLWTVSPLDASTAGSKQNTGDQNKRFIRWFWHIGSVVLLSTSAIALLQGLAVFEFQTQLLAFVSFLWLSITAIFFVISAKPPMQTFKMVPGLVGIPVNALLLAGLLL